MFNPFIVQKIVFAKPFCRPAISQDVGCEKTKKSNLLLDVVSQNYIQLVATRPRLLKYLLLLNVCCECPRRMPYCITNVHCCAYARFSASLVSRIDPQSIPFERRHSAPRTAGRPVKIGIEVVDEM